MWSLRNSIGCWIGSFSSKNLWSTRRPNMLQMVAITLQGYDKHLCPPSDWQSLLRLSDFENLFKAENFGTASLDLCSLRAQKSRSFQPATQTSLWYKRFLETYSWPALQTAMGLLMIANIEPHYNQRSCLMWSTFTSEIETHIKAEHGLAGHLHFRLVHNIRLWHMTSLQKGLQKQSSGSLL